MAGCRPLRGLSSLRLCPTPHLHAGLMNVVASRLTQPFGRSLHERGTISARVGIQILRPLICYI
jgi:hypothetical protein